MIEDQIKTAFSKVKQEMQLISNEIKELKNEITESKLIINDILNRLNSLEKTTKEQKINSSTGNDRANQSINHLINQSITNQSINQSNIPINAKYEGFRQTSEKKGVDHLINQSPINQSFDQSINQSQEEKLKDLTLDISKTFLSLSKQELKLFLTIYQLEDENIEPSYKNISIKMQLSEHCIRGHLSSLLRKNTPINKKRLNNHTNLLSISKEFRNLNLKQKLINLYYDADPHQKTLFDTN